MNQRLSSMLTGVALAGASLGFSQETPLIDRSIFFDNPEISGSQLSPDGAYLSFLKAYDGIMNIWVKGIEEPFEAARPLTNSKRPLYGYFWTDDAKNIIFVKDNDGDENLNVYMVSPSGNRTGSTPPESRNLTPMEGVAAQIYHVSKKNPNLIFIGLNNRDKAWHDLYKLNLSTGILDQLFTNTDRITGYDFDDNDELRLLYRTDEQGNTTLLSIQNDGLTPLLTVPVTESAYTAGWNEDLTKCFVVTNRGDRDKTALFLMNPVDGSMEFIESDPQERVDFGRLRIDQNTRKRISTSYVDDKTRVYWHDKQWEKYYNFLQKKFPGKEISFQSATNDYSKLLIVLSGDTAPLEVWIYDTKSKDLSFQYTSRPRLQEVETALSPMQAIRYKSSDGLEIPAYLSMPKGLEAKNLPVVVLVHGGPKGPRNYWGYDPEVQFLCNRGYAVLQPNFRASGGYGKAFLNAGDLQWGLLMQDDITWGVKYLIEQGIADPTRVAIMGGSYGGYATLAGLAFTPALYACGVDIVGPSNIFTLLESIPPYWEAGRAFLYGMVGDPNTEAGKQRIREASPLFHAEKIQRPLLIIQGANDPRVKKAEADQIVVALREQEHPVKYLLADDEGHGFAKPNNKMAMYAAVEEFLAQHLGGRYQKEMNPEIADRLEELTVDIASVTYKTQEDEKTMPALEASSHHLAPRTDRYIATLDHPEFKMQYTTERTVAPSNDGWMVTERIVDGAPEALDEVHFSAALVVRSRTIEQNGQKISMRFGRDAVEVEGMGQQVRLSFDGAMISDGAGLDLVLSGLSLTEGYSAVVNAIDMQLLQPKRLRIEVSAIDDDSDYPNCILVTLTNTEQPNDRIVVWLNREEGVAERIQQFIPQLNGASIVSNREK